MKNILVLLLVLFSIGVESCNMETYRRDRRNRMTARAKKSQHFLSKQAKEITAKNIKGKDSKFKEAEKRKAQQQADLNELNKPKNRKPTASGKFTVY